MNKGKSSGMKCYTGNLDGLRRGLIIASNQKEAAAGVGCSVYSFREFWSTTRTLPEQEIKPNTLYTQPFDSSGPWIEGRCEIKKRPAVNRHEDK